MFGRGFLFIAVIAAAIFIPYFLSERPITNDGYVQLDPVRQWWNSMWTDSIDGPVPSASPLPARRVGGGLAPSSRSFHSSRSYAPLLNRPQLSPSPPNRRFTPTPTSFGTASPMNGQAVPMATPWVPMGSPGQTVTNGAIVAPQTVPGGVAVGPWTPVNPQQAAGYGSAATAQVGGGIPTLDLRQLVNFEVTPDWVMQNWDRVSTQIWDGQWEGMRVPLVSGTSVHDLAGSLTYYFDREQTLQRVAFQGATGSLDLIQQMGMQLGLQPRPSFGGTTLVRETEDGLLTDLLRVRPLSGRAKSQLRRYDVRFELNRPGNGQGLSEALAKMLQSSDSLPSLDTRPLEDALRRQQNAGVPPGGFGFPASPGPPILDPSANVPN